jgi:hypothetical protein
MNTRALFNLILKVFGLVLVKDIIVLVVYTVQTLLMASIDIEYGLSSVSPYLLSIVVYGILIRLLLFKTKYVIDKLGLANGMDDEIPLKVHRSVVLNIAIIVLGGYILINELPNLLRLLYSMYREKIVTNGQNDVTTQPLILSLCKVIVASLLLGHRNRVINYIEADRKKLQKDL